MQHVKRVEIITGAVEVRWVIQALDELGIHDFTILEASGRGDRGARRGDDLTDVSKNSYLLLACAPEKVEAVVTAVRPLLAQFGGMCLISDAEWVKH